VKLREKHDLLVKTLAKPAAPANTAKTTRRIGGARKKPQTK